MPEKMPDVETLYNDFNIPLGQARYIIQAISYKRAGPLYLNAVGEILNSFDTGNVDKKCNTITIKILKSSENILKEIIFGIAYKNESIPAPQPQKEFGKFVYYPIRINDIESIKNKLQDRLKSSQKSISGGNK